MKCRFVQRFQGIKKLGNLARKAPEYCLTIWAFGQDNHLACKKMRQCHHSTTSALTK